MVSAPATKHRLKGSSRILAVRTRFAIFRDLQDADVGVRLAAIEALAVLAFYFFRVYALTLFEFKPQLLAKS